MEGFGDFTPPPPPGPPPRIPPGHRAVWSDRHEAFYYVNMRTGATLWQPIMVNDRAGGESQAGDSPQLAEDDIKMSDRDDSPYEDAAMFPREASPLSRDGEAQADGHPIHDGQSDHGATVAGDPSPLAAGDADISMDNGHSDVAIDTPPWVAADAGMEAERSDRTAEVQDNQPPVAGSRQAPINIDLSDIEEPLHHQGRDQGQKRPAKQSIYVAEVGETAARVTASTADLDSSMLSTIQKMLNRADQAGANENEAKTALKMATRLMHRFNITRAEVLAHNPEGQQQYTGQSLVNIRRRDLDPTKSVMMYVYVDTLAVAISTFFGTRSYNQRSSRGLNDPLVITFYGIAENTVAAAHAFEMSYNLLVGWSLKYKGTSQRNSYCYGVSKALKALANQEKDEEEQAAILAEKDEENRRIRQERADEKARLNRLNESSAYETPDNHDADGRQDPVDSGIESRGSENDFGGEEDDIDESGNDYGFDSALDSHDGGFDTAGLLLSTVSQPTTTATSLPPDVPSIPTPSRPTGESSSKADDDPEPSWTNHAQLVAYRNTREKMAEDFLKENGIKLGKARAKKINKLDQAAYDQGKKDAKKINVRRRALQE